MKYTAIYLFCLYVVSAHPAGVQIADECSEDRCLIENNCRCSSRSSPLKEGTSPQLIVLTFDEAVVSSSFSDYWEPLLFGRTNPDGNPISGTFFVPHEYTDYEMVQKLYLEGFEIGVASITKNPLVEYWKTATKETLIDEFGGQRTIISHFANIPIEDVVGARTPQLQLNGDVSIEAYQESGIQYDSSWTSHSTAPFFPYTLDYLSIQPCRHDIVCPKESHPGFWIAPINDIRGPGNNECNSLVQCGANGTADEIAQWLLSEVERSRNVYFEAPITLIISSPFFLTVPTAFEGLQKFLDGLGDDVFLVSQKQALDWVKNPVPLEQFRTEVTNRTATCLIILCPLLNNNGDIRYMKSCVRCPDVYPWLGNPLGEKTLS